MKKTNANSMDLFFELVRPFQSTTETQDTHERVGGRVIRSEFWIKAGVGIGEVECEDGSWIRICNRGYGWAYTSYRQLEQFGELRPAAVTSVAMLRKLIEADLKERPAAEAPTI